MTIKILLSGAFQTSSFKLQASDIDTITRSCIHNSTRCGGSSGFLKPDQPHITCNFGHPTKETAHIYVGPIPPKPAIPRIRDLGFWKYPDKLTDVVWFPVKDRTMQVATKFVWCDEK